VLPILVDIFPSGTIAGSAGKVITWEGHRAGRAPDTAVGAVTPVNSGEIEIVDVKGIHLIGHPIN